MNANAQQFTLKQAFGFVTLVCIGLTSPYSGMMAHLLLVTSALLFTAATAVVMVYRKHLSRVVGISYAIVTCLGIPVVLFQQHPMTGGTHFRSIIFSFEHDGLTLFQFYGTFGIVSFLLSRWLLILLFVAAIYLGIAAMISRQVATPSIRR